MMKILTMIRLMVVEFGENIDEMTSKFDDLVQGDDYHHLHWHDCNFYRRS